MTISVKVKYSTTDVLPIGKDITLYLFKNVSIHDGYTYAGNGYLKNSSGVKILYSEKATTSFAFHIFRDLEKTTHTVVVDGADIFNENVKTKYQIGSDNLGNDLNTNGGTIDFTWDIWPYKPWDVYQ